MLSQHKVNKKKKNTNLYCENFSFPYKNYTDRQKRPKNCHKNQTKEDYSNKSNVRNPHFPQIIATGEKEHINRK